MKFQLKNQAKKAFLFFTGIFLSMSGFSATYYLSPTGNDLLGDGTINKPWFTLQKAWTAINPGDLVYLRGGTYTYSYKQDLRYKNGTAEKKISIFAYPDETPNLTTHSTTFNEGRWPPCLILLNGDYFHWKGIEISNCIQRLDGTGVGGMSVVDSDNNIFETLNIHHSIYGLQILGTSNENLVLNSDFHHNSNKYGPNPYKSGDGVEFINSISGISNTMKGCRLYWNSDNGLDLYKNDGVVLIENTWSFYNGFIPETSIAGGSGNGFSFGISDEDHGSEILITAKNCLSVKNRKAGFHQNGVKAAVAVYNNTAYLNGSQGYWFGSFDKANKVTNNISYNNGENCTLTNESRVATNTFLINSTENTAYPVSNIDFISINQAQLLRARKADGNLPDIDFLKLVLTSGLIDAGTTIGFPYNGTAPDIGAFESEIDDRTESDSTTNSTDATYYLAPSGNDVLGDGSISKPWFSLQKAWTAINAGDIVYLRGGTYTYIDKQVLRFKNGTAQKKISIFAYPGETPNLTTHSTTFNEGRWPPCLILLYGDYFHWRGIEISNCIQRLDGTGVGGMTVVDSDNNIFETLNIHHSIYGLQIMGTSNENLVLNSDFHHNSNKYGSNPYKNADGVEFINSISGVSNSMKGCRIYWNSDNGLDLYKNDGVVLIENTWSFYNGFIPETSIAGGSGNGFSFGISDDDHGSEILITAKNCLSVKNRKAGFHQNGVKAAVALYNNTAYLNGAQGYWLGSLDKVNKVANNISYSNADYCTLTNESWVATNTFLINSTENTAYPVSNIDFLSIDQDQLLSVRKADGSLPDIDFLKLISTSGLIDAGTKIGFPYSGSAPDIGAFEHEIDDRAESEGPTNSTVATYYLAPTGNDILGDGSISKPWFSLQKAWTAINAGDIVYLRGGTYTYSYKQDLRNKNGTAQKKISIFAYPGEIPNLTTHSTTFKEGSWPPCLILLYGDYFHWRGIEISNCLQRLDGTGVGGMTVIDSDNNIFETLNIHHSIYGFQMRGTSNGNLVLNSDFHHNSNKYGPNPYKNADGVEFINSISGISNTMKGCRLYWNSDDGLDLYKNDGVVLIENTWSFYNGFIPGTFTPGGDGNGFKFGISDEDHGLDILITAKKCLSVRNRTSGFHQNGAKAAVALYNNTAYLNGAQGYWFGSFDKVNKVANNISYSNAEYCTLTNESWVVTNTFLINSRVNSAYSVSNSDFVSSDQTQLLRARKADGSLPDIDFLKLSPTSDLIDAGTKVGIPYSGSAPDIGAFEIGNINSNETTQSNTLKSATIVPDSKNEVNLISGNEDKSTDQLNIDILGQTNVLRNLMTGTSKVQNNEELIKIDIFPNPSRDNLNVRFSEMPETGSYIEIMDFTGRKVVTRKITSTNEIFSLAQQPAGLYLVKTILGSKEVINKLIINK